MAKKNDVKAQYRYWTGMNKVYKTIPYPGILVSFGSFQKDWMMRNEDRKDHDDDTKASEMEEDRVILITENWRLE